MYMSRNKIRATFVIYLILSTLGPCKSFRAQGDLIRFEAEKNNDGFHENPRAASCPYGLEPTDDTAVCKYPDKSGRSSDLFKGFSKAPLLFNSTASGTYLVESQFAVELAEAFLDRPNWYRVGASLAALEQERNKSFAKSVNEQMANKPSVIHKLERDNQLAVFVVEEAIKHTGLHALEVGLHGLAHAAQHGAVFGTAELTAIIGPLVITGSTVVAFLLQWVIPVIVSIELVAVLFKMHKLQKKQNAHAKRFAYSMVYKSSCFITKLEEATKSMKLKPLIAEVCGDGVSTDLRKQIHATNLAKIKLHETIASMGRCLWPHGNRKNSKAMCTETIYYKLLQSKHQPGFLYVTLSFMAYYSFRVDELTEEPFYEHWTVHEFGIKKEEGMISLLSALTEAKNASIENRFRTCVYMLATHRAFERTFQRLNQAIQVWLRSFARTFFRLSSRTGPVPCKKVFYTIGNESEGGFCKQFDWKQRNGEEEVAMDESNACEKAENYTGSLWPETEDQDGENHSDAKKGAHH